MMAEITRVVVGVKIGTIVAETEFLVTDIDEYSIRQVIMHSATKLARAVLKKDEAAP